MSDSAHAHGHFGDRFRNWLSLSGLVIMLGSVFAFLMLFIVDLMKGSANPYIGILTYLVAPAFSTLGVSLVVLGIVLKRRQERREGRRTPIVIDLSRPRDRRILGFFIVGSIVFLFISAFGSYTSYQFTESVTFCGQACHEVMEPEMVTYSHSPHAKVACVECHIGPGAEWFVRAKLSGSYQVYATALDKYPRPVPTPIKNLRPARDTCEHCHWPQRFSGDLVRNYHHFLSDEENSEYTVRLMLRVGGGDPDQREVSGIHWHIANKVEYIATDESRLEIPWVRHTDSEGRQTEFRVPEFTDDIAQHEIRTMDCIDCHNRPAHIYKKPNDAVDRALAQGWIDRSLPGIRAKATEVLVQEYATKEEALARIAESLTAAYPDQPAIRPAIEAVQRIYADNFFPTMKANWRAYPEHIGHKDWPGCVRCHDDRHVSTDGTRTISFSNCNSCHLILAQGQGDELESMTLGGQEFKHPGEEYDPAFKCHDCHTGGP
jgi:hypothetical protein